MRAWTAAERERASERELRRYKRSSTLSGHATTTLRIPLAYMLLLETHARKRGLTEHELARRMIECCIDGGLVDAVLDDGADG